MSNCLLVASRKGLFTVARSGGAGSPWEVASVAFLGHPLSMTLRDPRDGCLYAALNLGHFGPKLHRSDDDGQTWKECAVPVLPQGTTIPTGMPGPDGKRGTKPASVSEIWSLEPGGPGEAGLLWAGTIPGGLYRSQDRGDSWQLVESLWNRPEREQWFGGGKDDPGIHSICVDPRDSRHVAVGVSCGGVWVTKDAGETWACQATGMRAAYMPPELAHEPNIQDDHRLVQCPSQPDAFWVQHHNGIFRTTDGAASWQEIASAGPSTFGFAVAVHPGDPQTAWFAPAVKDETRVPVDAKVVVTRTRDGGASFDILTAGLPQRNAYDLVFRHGLDVDATGNVLAMGSTTGSLWISEDGGDSWQTVSTHLPPIYAVRFAG